MLKRAQIGQHLRGITIYSAQEHLSNANTRLQA